jgi:uncharacterized spore protein YtfJ
VNIDQLFAKVTDPLQARMVYAEPVEKDGITVIAAARLAGGGGGGNGADEQGRNGEGVGIGITAKPTGAFVIKNGTVRWRPAVDVNQALAVVGAVTVTALVVVGRILRTRSG